MKLCECGCGKPAVKRFVHGHNPNQWVKLGLTARFWSKVNKQGPIVHASLGRCWLWTGSMSKKGYGRARVNSKLELAHRIAWLLETGAWPNTQALHKCDNRACVRFSHLFEGTNRDNVDDMLSKGRIHRAKLTPKQVQSIRKAQESYSILAIKFGVSSSQICKIITRQQWRHL